MMKKRVENALVVAVVSVVCGSILVILSQVVHQSGQSAVWKAHYPYVMTF